MSFSDHGKLHILPYYGIVSDNVTLTMPVVTYIILHELHDVTIRNSTNRQHNDENKQYKRTNNDLQNMYIKKKIE
jgi:hypothetical protein